MGRNNRDVIYMAVTNDRLELPLFWEDSLQAFADKIGISKDAVSSAITHKRTGNRRGYKLIRVDMEEVHS